VRQVGYLQEMNRDARSTEHRSQENYQKFYTEHYISSSVLSPESDTFSAGRKCFFHFDSHIHCTTASKIALAPFSTR